MKTFSLDLCGVALKTTKMACSVQCITVFRHIQNVLFHKMLCYLIICISHVVSQIWLILFFFCAARKWWRITIWYAIWTLARPWAMPQLSAQTRLGRWPPTEWQQWNALWLMSITKRYQIPAPSPPKLWKHWSTLYPSTAPTLQKYWWEIKPY